MPILYFRGSPIYSPKIPTKHRADLLEKSFLLKNINVWNFLNFSNISENINYGWRSNFISCVNCDAANYAAKVLPFMLFSYKKFIIIWVKQLNKRHDEFIEQIKERNLSTWRKILVNQNRSNSVLSLFYN